LIDLEAPKIKVVDLHKSFVLHDLRIGSVKSLLLRSKHKAAPKRQVKHVLRGVSFDVHRRECVAIIGRNGAGKSTMLSIAAKIYLPTSGSVAVNGRVAPLLELGSGFHQELTGVENIFFNGMLLGLSQDQITERLDEIIDFAGIREYVNEPVRTYSSGMIARLGFSVASHVDAEILIVDESLAVGDYQFVQKCYEYIRRFQMRGGTILFVSHAASTVKDVATRCIWIEDGIIRMDGEPKAVIDAYQGKAPSIESAAE
jgi:ABC-type polysaccharide/polyol phosphate transport system ATPase subunit